MYITLILFVFLVFSLDTIKIINDQTPFKRITQGIQTHPQKLDDFLSFSLGLTQIFKEFTGPFAKSQINQQKIRLQYQNDPMKMQ